MAVVTPAARDVWESVNPIENQIEREHIERENIERAKDVLMQSRDSLRKLEASRPNVKSAAMKKFGGGTTFVTIGEPMPEPEPGSTDRRMPTTDDYLQLVQATLQEIGRNLQNINITAITLNPFRNNDFNSTAWNDLVSEIQKHLINIMRDFRVEVRTNNWKPKNKIE